MNKEKNDIFMQGPIPPERIATSIATHGRKSDIGAHSIFLGQIRADQVDGKNGARD